MNRVSLKRKMLTLVALVIGTSTSMFGCAATTIKVPRMKPAEINLAGIKKIAVSSISGEGGEDIADQLTQALMQSGRYDVVDRQHLAKVQQEQSLGENGVVDASSAAQVGKVAGADALIFGRVSKDKYTEKVASAQGTRRDKNGVTNYTAYKRQGILDLRVSTKVINTSTGRILATKMLESTKGMEKSAEADGPPVTDPSQLNEIIPPLDAADETRRAAQQEVVSNFMKMIAPYQVMVAVILYDEGDLPTTKAGVGYAKSGDWNSAIREFKAAVAQANGNPEIDSKVKGRAVYNVGVALGYSGQYDEGIAKIKEAYNIFQDEGFLSEARKIEGFKSDEAELNKQIEDAGN